MDYYIIIIAYGLYGGNVFTKDRPADRLDNHNDIFAQLNCPVNEKLLLL